MVIKKMILIILVGLFMSACGQQTQSSGDPASGESLFNQTTINSAPGCKTCHSIEVGKVIVGPSLAGIANRASTRVTGQTASEYLRNCILDPNLYVVDGFAPGIMFQKYKEVLTEKQITNLVAYLSTLK